jgi:hypothetical protein
LAVLEFFWGDENKGKFGQVHFYPSFDNIIALVPWDKLAGAGTCLDQSHCVLGRVAGLLLIRKWVLIFFFHVCDRPYRVIAVIPRVHERQNCGNS